jgi:hypothetical protein
MLLRKKKLWYALNVKMLYQLAKPMQNAQVYGLKMPSTFVPVGSWKVLKYHGSQAKTNVVK